MTGASTAQEGGAGRRRVSSQVALFEFTSVPNPPAPTSPWQCMMVDALRRVKLPAAVLARDATHSPATQAID